MTRRPEVLLLVALLGVLAAIGTVLSDLLGPVAGVVYAVVAVALVLVGAGRARAAQAARARSAARAAGRTCTCCTTSQHDPVRVV